jgi:glycosyltransferase involved in cell wall biosynthesis
MNIAYVSDVVYPYVKGGAEKRIYEMGRRLTTYDEVHVFGIKWWEGTKDIDLDGIHLHGICKPLSLYAGERRSFREAIRFAGSLGPLSAYDLDVIDCNQFPYLHCFPSKLISRLNGIPLVVTWHEFWDNYWKEYLGPIGVLGKLTERAVLRAADKAIAVSEATKDHLVHLKQDIELVPNGVDIAFIDSVAPAKISVDTLFVGRLIRQKNVDLLIRALPTDATLCIIGDGPEKENLISLAKEVNATVRFVRTLSYADLISVMKAANSLVLPSTREGFGIVALEALACGTPVITTNVEMNAAKELITHEENGFLVSPTVNAIRSALSEISKKQMHRAAKASAAPFDWNLLSEKLRNIYRALT